MQNDDWTSHESNNDNLLKLDLDKLSSAIPNQKLFDELDQNPQEKEQQLTLRNQEIFEFTQEE